MVQLLSNGGGQMMVAIGNFLFRYRNFLFPVFYTALFLPSPRVTGNTGTAALVGLAVILAGQAIRVLTIGLVYIIRGGSKRRIFARDLVTTGMFAHCRNPLYVGNLLVLLGLGIMSDSLVFLAIFMPLFIFFYQAIVRSEEAFLLGKFGDGFRDYTQEVNRWIPSLSGIGDTLGSMRFRWRRVILKEYNASFIWMLGAVIIYMNNLHRDDSTRFSAALPGAMVVLAALTLLYFVIRHLKKSKKLRDM